jgi:hypothetical protein
MSIIVTAANGVKVCVSTLKRKDAISIPRDPRQSAGELHR